MGEFKITVSPEKVHLNIFGGIDVSQSVTTVWFVMGIVIVFGLIFRFILFKRFKETPKGFQNVMELCVDGINKFTNGIMGEKGSSMAAYAFTLAVLLVVSGLAELLGVRAPATDINFTASIAIMTFVLIFAMSIRFRGILGPVKFLTHPMPVIFPVKLVTEFALPISLSCRMFGNMFSGLLVMDLLYFVLKYAAIGIPAILSIYFNLFHVGMQTYIFLTLSLSFIHEAVE